MHQRGLLMEGIAHRAAYCTQTDLVYPD
jgi:hypothetical protein